MKRRVLDSTRPLVLTCVLALGPAALPSCASAPGGGNNGGDPAATGGRGGGGGGKAGRGGAAGTSDPEGNASGGAAGQATPGAGGTAAGSGGSNPGGPSGSGGAGAGDSDAAGASDSGGAPAEIPGPPGKSMYSKLVKLDTTATGANVSGDVPKYPVAIVLGATTFDFAQAKPKGEDLRFSTMDGAPLPHAIELWDATAKIAAVWVKVDVKGASTQMIKMSWGDSGASDGSNSAAVFDTKDGFLGVWHLSEPASTTMGGYKDATGNAADGTGVSLDATSSDQGRVGRATSLLNGKKQYIQIDGDKNQLFDVYEKMTYSIWAKPKSHTVSYQCMFSKGETGFRLHFYGEAGWNGGKNITEMCAEEVGGGDFCPVNHKGVDVAANKWFLLTGVQDKPKGTYYINGVQEATSTDGAAWTSGPMKAVMIGNNASMLTRAFDGVLDEARILGVVKDANWIKLDYESQREGQKFLTFGEPQKN